MKTLILPMALLAMIALPATADAASPCRNAKGQFAKCGTPGAMAPGAKAMKAAPAMKPAMAAPAMKPAMAAPAMKAAPAMAMKPGTPAMAPAKKGPCKDTKGKFVKC